MKARRLVCFVSFAVGPALSGSLCAEPANLAVGRVAAVESVVMVTGRILGNAYASGAVLPPLGETGADSGYPATFTPYNVSSGAAALSASHPVTAETTLNLSTVVTGFHLQSDVDGAEGSRSSTASASILSASAGFEIDTGSDTVGLYQITLDSPGAIVANAIATWDGTADGSGLSRLSTTAPAGITISVLGTELIVPALTAENPVVTLSVDVLTPALGSATGDITLTGDLIESNFAPGVAVVTATSLRVSVDLQIELTSAPSLTSFEVTNTLHFNRVTSAIAAVPVPEPAGTALLLLAGSLLTARRRPA